MDRLRRPDMQIPGATSGMNSVDVGSHMLSDRCTATASASVDVIRVLPSVRARLEEVLRQLAARRPAERLPADWACLDRAGSLAAPEFAVGATQEHELPADRPS